MTQVHTDDTLYEMEKRFALGSEGRHFWTRERAREIRPRLTALLEELATGDVLVVDLEGVDGFDYSFANELFGRTLLSLSGMYPGRFLVVERLQEHVREDLAQALEAIDMAMIERDGDELRLLGRVHPADDDTFQTIAAAHDPVTAAALRDRLGINVNAANERLAKLVDLGLVRREKGRSPAGREQFMYRVLS